jgi:hypothetical protein
MNQLKAALLRTAIEVADSKKWMGAILAFIAYLSLRLAGKLHLGLSPDEAREIAQQVVYLGLVAVGGQALADHGAQGAKAPSSPLEALETIAVDVEKAQHQQGASPPAPPSIQVPDSIALKPETKVNP